MDRTNFDEQPPHAQQERRGQGHAPERPQEEQHKIDMARLRDVGRNLATQLEQQAVKRPFVVIGAAAGVGFLAGSLFGSRLGQALLAAAAGYFAKNVLESDIGLKRLEDNLERLAHERTRA
jgi:hypothetical protein